MVLVMYVVETIVTVALAASPDVDRAAWNVWSERTYAA